MTLRKFRSIIRKQRIAAKYCRGDGNCFFNSIIASTDKFQTAQELRDCVCKHLRENFKVYKAFLTFDQSKTEEEQHIEY